MSDTSEIQMLPDWPRKIDKTCPKCGAPRQKHEDNLESCTECNWYIKPGGTGRRVSNEERIEQLEQKVRDLEIRLQALETRP